MASTVTQWLDPLGARIFTTVTAPELVQANGTNYPLGGYAFDSAAVEGIYFEVPAPNYGASNPSVTILIDWYTSDSTSHNAVWGAQVSVTTPADAQSLLTDAFATQVTATSANTTTANSHNRATITITNTNLDSLTANDRLCLSIQRLGNNGSDTVTADAICFGVWVQYPDA